MSQRLGDLLVKEKIITPEQLEQATKAQKEQSCRLGSALVKLGFLTDEDVTNFLSRQYGVPAINLSYFEIDPAVVKLIPFETAKRYQILPLSRVGASLTIAIVDPARMAGLPHRRRRPQRQVARVDRGGRRGTAAANAHFALNG